MNALAYNLGTIAINNNSNVITGTGVNWLDDRVQQFGFIFLTDSEQIFLINTIDDATHIHAWNNNKTGANISGASYTLISFPSAMQTALNIQAIIAFLKQTALTIWLTGTTAPSGGDGIDGNGCVYFNTSTGIMGFYTKASGSWTLQFSFNTQTANDARYLLKSGAVASGGLILNGETVPSTGVGLEQGWRGSANTAFIRPYDRTNGADKNLLIDSSGLTLNGQTTGDIALATGGGNIGLGTTAGVSSKVRIGGTSRHVGRTDPTTNPSLETFFDATTNTSGHFSFNRSTSAWLNYLIDGNPLALNSQSHNTVYTGGKFGVNNNSPQSNFEVTGSMRVGGAGSTPSSGAGMEIFFVSGTGVRQLAYDRGAGAYLGYFQDGSPLFLNSQTSGNVIIGNNSGAAGNSKLTVVGGIAPAADNAYPLGNPTGPFRFTAVYASNGAIQTSDERDKEHIAFIDKLKAYTILRNLNPRLFKWLIGGNVPEEVDDEPETVEVQATEDVQVTTYDIVDGKAVSVTTTVQRLLFDSFPVFDEAGKPVMRTVTDAKPAIPEVPAVAEIRDADGNVTRAASEAIPEVPAVDAVMTQLMHDVPRMVTEQRPRKKIVYTAKAGQRPHAGFFAQDWQQQLEAQDLVSGVWGLDDKDDPNSKQFLRPDQETPYLWASAQHMADLIEQQAATIADLVTRLTALEAK